MIGRVGARAFAVLTESVSPALNATAFDVSEQVVAVPVIEHVVLVADPFFITV